MHLIHVAPDKIDLFREHFRADFNSSKNRDNRNTAMTEPDRNQRFQPPSICSSIGIYPVPLIAVSHAESDQPVLISGFRRFHQYLAAGCKEIPVMVVPSEIIDSWISTALSATSYVIQEKDWEARGWFVAIQNLSPVYHSPLEIAGVLGRASRYTGLPVRQLDDLCSALAGDSHASAIITASSLSMTFLRRCHAWNLDVSKVALLSRYRAEERPPATLLCLVLKLSVSRMRRLEELVRDIALRENRAVHDLLRELLRSITQDATGSEPVDDQTMNAAVWMQRLEARRNPEYEKLSARFADAVRKVSLRKNVSVQPPGQFEGDYIDFQIRIRSMEEFHDVMELLRERAGEINDVLDIVRND